MVCDFIFYDTAIITMYTKSICLPAILKMPDLGPAFLV
jgi:hypothetical protein